MEKVVAILTGDIINSRNSSANTWLSVLKKALKGIAGEKDWEIFRGDSFQVQASPEDALTKAIYLKASIKAIKDLDVRIAIGIGGKDFSSKKISESNGQAFIYSGEMLEELKESRVSLAIRTSRDEFDYEMNVAIRLALIVIDTWSPISAQLVKLSIENPGISQKELAELTKKTQSTVSEALKRARLSEILELDALYRKKVGNLLSS